ncbi:BhlA/UviB family holin-like peptide [Brevibacillus laterosporus]|nr:BhlA/UviB family holin-like peptide [Brevibacillus laterosporus]
MEESVMNAFLQQGPFAALFVWLLFSTKKEGRESARPN